MEASVVSCAAARLGYSSMKPEQLDVVVKFIQGRDVFAVQSSDSLRRVPHALQIVNYL